MTTRALTRRRFLQGMTVAGAALAAPCVVPATAIGAGERPAPSNRLVMGAVGVGGRGTADMRSFLGFSEIQMVAACDVQASNRDKARTIVDQQYGDSGCKTYNDFREIVGRPDIDAICIGTPDHWHAIPTIRACRSGKDVYCEKPLSLTIREGRAMVEAARKYGRVVSSGSQRVLGDYGRLAGVVRSGALGDIREVYVNVGGPSRPCYLPPEPVPEGFDYDMWLGQAPYEPYNKGRVAGTYGGQSGWRAWQDYSGGMMTDWGGHKFGAALFALGLEETGPVEIIPPDGKDYQYLTYRFANGVLMYHAPGAGVDITFKGTLGEAGGKQGRSGAAVPPADMPGYRGSGGIHGDWFYCTRTRQRPFQDVGIGHRAATVCHLGNIAYWLNRRLRWDPVKEEILGDPEAGRWLDRPRRAPWVL